MWHGLINIRERQVFEVDPYRKRWCPMPRCFGVHISTLTVHKATKLLQNNVLWCPPSRYFWSGPRARFFLLLTLKTFEFAQ